MNGSRVDGGCKVNITFHYCGDGSESFLNDDDDPVINTTDPNWASELVTVRKNNATRYIPYDYAVLSFFFSTTCIIDINQTEPVQVSSVGHWSFKLHCVCRYGY